MLINVKRRNCSDRNTQCQPQDKKHKSLYTAFLNIHDYRNEKLVKRKEAVILFLKFSSLRPMQTATHAVNAILVSSLLFSTYRRSPFTSVCKCVRLPVWNRTPDVAVSEVSSAM